MKVGIFINTAKDEANIAANVFSGMLTDADIGSKVVNLKEDCKDVDAIAVFGGDGTILRVVEFAAFYDLPILAVNIGKLGFLSSVESNELEYAVKLLKDQKEFDKRSILKVYAGENFYYALNDAVVQRNMAGYTMNEVVHLSLEVNENPVNEFYADGLIVSTPTGSTAYSLSAGGSIMTPDVNAIIATPICSHTLNNRPIVMSDSCKIKVNVLENTAKCALYVDGKFVKQLNYNESITVVKSKKTVKFYTKNVDFFEKLSVKLNNWSSVK